LHGIAPSERVELPPAPALGKPRARLRQKAFTKSNGFAAGPVCSHAPHDNFYGNNSLEIRR
jgi:hypothetical protein